MSAPMLLQAFHWYTHGGGSLWRDIDAKSRDLAAMGITHVWLPPAYKGAAGAESVGYDTYDLFDLGEFDQKGSVPTKYGDRASLERACTALRNQGIRVIHDVVFNHKMGADERERVTVRRVNEQDRTQIEDEAFEAFAHTRFTFPGREGKHSKFIWDKSCFSGVDVIEEPDESGVYRLVNAYGEGQWNADVDQEFGNYDFLLGADVEFRNKAVSEELKFWGRWLAEQVPVGGFRLDAAKHVPAWFFKEWVGHMRDSLGDDLFVVAEYWHPDMDTLNAYLDSVDRQVMLFDVALNHRFHDASKLGRDFDLRTIFDGSLVASLPEHAVTLVDNHDTQPLQSMEACVEPWFKPIAYALILLREHGLPCIFAPDLEGATYRDKGSDENEYNVEMPAIACLPKLMEARRRFANGPQTDLFEHPFCIGFIRHGTGEAPGCVTVVSNGDASEINADLGNDHAGATFADFLGHRQDKIQVDRDGRATFPAEGGSVSVWVRCEAMEKDA
ncbi:alpha-amylase [Sinorhizobium sp. RAC02]|uniref:alpha-amylase n=1 Tax=Sinorhizobium sp. RAC02 TaxID=1842534 RepID=UPI00083CD73E|nr:alpha-amylase [Sinorhizobium sp. RAC02]AOF93630.1 alpha amylase, catalytic domain protein [Sinorhizobium sp. RAC02]